MKNFFTNLWVHIVFVFAFAFLVVFRCNGFCTSVTSGTLALNPSSISQFEAFSSAMAQNGIGFNCAPPEIALTELLNNINYNLYEVYGYDLNDLVQDSWNALINPSEWSNRLTKFATGEATIDGSRVEISVADKIAQRISQGALTGAVTAKNLVDAGYAYFSTAVPQWGENAKQFFIGKRDEITGAITDVAPTMVTKITAQGLAAYNQVYNNLLGNGAISKPILNKPIYSNTLSFSTPAQSVSFFRLTSSVPLYFYSYDSANYPYGAQVHLVVPSEFFDVSSRRVISSVSGLFTYSSGTTDILNLYLDSPSSFTINDRLFYYGVVRFNDSSFGWIPYSPYSLGTLNNVKTLISDDFSSSYATSYDYSSSSSLSVALKDQLDRLIDKYVDSLTLGRINDIVASIPIGQELVGETDVPVAIPTQEVVDKLTGVIDDALELDEAYALAFDDAYAEPIDTTADPTPDFPQFPSGVPEEYVPPFLLDLFPADMFSMFEPIFDIVGDQYSMFDTWLLIPAIFIFLFIFYVIISVL